MNELLDIGWRTSLVLCLLLIIARILGRRTLAQLTFFDFAVGIIIGNIAVLILSDRSMEIVLILASLVIVTFWVLVISFVSRKSLPARKILESQPILVIYKGRILEENLKKRYYNVNDLLELLREQEVFSPSHVEAALIETDGH
ncbi:MAG: YetF domain-containing protein [Veillonellales bacterium]